MSRWEHCKACNKLLDESDLLLDRLGELCKYCLTEADIPLPFKDLDIEDDRELDDFEEDLGGDHE